jgi:agmatine deiminase
MTDSRDLTAPRVPADWEPQAAVWLAWPHRLATWPGRFEKIPPFFAHWARVIAESTPVRILASQEVAKQCEQLLGRADNIEILDIPTNDCWIRDYGPTFISRDGQISAVKWRFNSWGGKYSPWDADDAAAEKLCRAARIEVETGALCLEGGAMEFDGAGRMLTTPVCLITDTRNPGWTKQEISRELHRRLGVTEIVWLDGGGLEGDDTDGHVDQLARFIDQQNIVVAVSDNEGDSIQSGLQNNYRQLQMWSTATRPVVNIHRLPVPPPRLIEGQRVPESYCNYLRLGPDRLLAPTFGAKTDSHAIGLLRELSGAEVVELDCQELIWGRGALHCASREQPA